MQLIYAPNKADQKRISVFLAGSIEMGLAEPWQDEVVKHLSSLNINVYNPRRLDWDNSWGENSKELQEQICWELDNIESCDTIFFYFDPNTKSPITLLELGIALRSKKDVVVVCPNFWRRTNVLVTCKKYGVDVNNTLLGGIVELIINLGNKVEEV